MKKILTLLLIMALAVSVLASCDKIPGLNKIKLPWQKDEPATDNTDNNNDVVIPAEDADLKAAYDFVHNNVKDIAEKTNANYTVPGVAPTKNTSFTVKWEVSDERIVLQTSEDGTLVTVVVPEPGDADIAYTLKFTVTNAKGESLSREYNHIVPKFQVNTYAEYRAAKDGDPLVVEGVVYGIMSKAAGDAENSVFVQDLVSGGGYYVYQVSDETIASVALGQTVKVKGNKKAYYDLPEIVDATIEVTNTEVTTLTPTDITAIFKSVDNATDKDSPLLNYVGGYVTIKGVTLLEAGTNGYYYFELDGVKTYFRISSSSNCTTKDEETKIKNNFNNNFYHTADLTGIATLYKSGDEYWFNVMPLTGDMLSNFSEEMQPMPDDVKAQFILDKISVPSEMVSTNPVDLPLVGTSVINMSVFENVNIAWTLAETANATLAEGVLTAVLPESGSVEITLTVNVTVNNAVKTKDVTVTVRKATTLTITEANAKAEEGGTNYTADKFIVEGIIDEVKSDKYGNVYIKDAEGNRLYVYGIYSAYGELRYDAMAKNGEVPKLGDKVVLYGILGVYGSDKQMKSAWLLSWEHVHTCNIKGETVAPTCGDGYTVYSCYCGLVEEKRDIVAGTGEHTIEQNTAWHPEMVNATCTTPGVAVFECTVCDYYYTQATEIDPEAHNFLDWECESEVITAADCTTKTDGVKRIKCLYCDATDDKPIDYTTVHNWVADVDTQPTCTVDGAYHAVCTLCQEVDEYPRPAQGHFNYILTCGQTGECLECGEQFTKEHEGSAATCTEPAFCFNCWSPYGEPLGHDWDENDPNSVCSVCGLANHVCDFSVKGDTVNPTCTEGGYTVYHCSQEGCSETENKELTEATNHEGTTEEKEAVAPTCSAVGYAAGVYCTACQTWLSGHEEQPIVADAHNYVDHVCEYCEKDDPAHYFVMSNADAAQEDDGKKVQVSGTVCSIDGVWNSSYNNMNVTIIDAAGNKLYIYRLGTQVALGDIVTIKGEMGTYNGRQVVNGTATIDGHDSSYDYNEMSIADAIASDDGTNVQISGVVIEINTAYSESYNNISVTISDGTSTIYLYRLTGNVSVNDIITVKGTKTTYAATGQVQVTGGTFEKTGTHGEHTYTQGACDATSTCTACGVAKGEHSWDDGEVTTAATCLAKGVKTYTCDCTAEKTEDVAILEHSYTGEGGVCVNGCGQTEGNAPVVQYNKVTSAAEFTTGTYVVIVEKKFVTVSTIDGSWVKGTAQSAIPESFDQATGDGLAITLEVVDGGVKIKIGDQYIAPSGGNNNGIKTGEYVWAYTFQDDGTVVFAGTGSDTVYLAYNAQSSGFRGYKTSTVTGSSYPYKFTVYKLG